MENPPQRWTTENLVAAYVQYHQRTRGIADHSLRAYSRYVHEILTGSLGKGTIDPSALCVSDVIQFISLKMGEYRPRTVKQVATALRLFFRFLRALGISDTRLDESVPTVAGYRLADIPRSLSEDQHRKLLSSLTGSTPCSRRDRAIIKCLSNLGLRAGEVAALLLEDIDWRLGTVSLRTRKTGRGAVLPLDHDTGCAVVDYLRDGRPRTHDHHLFVLHRGATGTAISGSLVARVVRQQLLRAGIVAPSYGAHLLRHTLATRMVRSGARIHEIADVLGHRSLQTTLIYAKADFTSLGDVALPWPGRVS